MELISPEGRRCWIGIRANQRGTVEWIHVDDKHMESYFQTIPDEDYAIFVYYAGTGATEYRRLLDSPTDIVSSFDTSHAELTEDLQEKQEWTLRYRLVSTGSSEAFPITYKQTFPGDDLNRFTFVLVEKSE